MKDSGLFTAEEVLAYHNGELHITTFSEEQQAVIRTAEIIAEDEEDWCDECCNQFCTCDDYGI
jgi:hypothetical protein